MNLSATAFVAFLLLIFLAGAAPTKGGARPNYDGKCQGTFPARCWCIGNRCPGAAAPDEGGDRVAAASGGRLAKKEGESPRGIEWHGNNMR
ncbi:hypothetical protein HU200_013660 [Digitaria exilis]|uniref:Uncharacterized protein n=1 Tax=Digitaria exilis TaxID=1010633 RepID=A0A835FE66_9POAL|nr:hypothetical protein HU200_013660 [Digitaria exilis]